MGSGKALDVAGGSTANGANVEIFTDTGGANQRWLFAPTSGGYYLITAVHNGKALDSVGRSTADGVNVDQWTATGATNQQWQLAAP